MFVPFPLGKYTVIGRVRFGGMSEVLRAESVDDRGTIMQWAIKRPLPTVMEDPELLALFWKESELMQKMKHSAFPEVEEVSVVRGVPFIVMEFVSGATVRQILSWQKSTGNQVRPEVWVLMVADLASAVEHLHRFRRGATQLVHGDIRPSNIMVDEDGYVRLLDLGLALASPRLWRRVIRNREDRLPPFLREQEDKIPEVDTYSMGKLLTDCLGDHARSQLKERLPAGLVDVIQRSVDESGLYVFKTARSFRREVAGYLNQAREDRIREELAETAAAVCKDLQDPGS